MVSFSMNDLVHWFAINVNVLAAVVTIGVAVFLICCLACIIHEHIANGVLGGTRLPKMATAA